MSDLPHSPGQSKSNGQMQHQGKGNAPVLSVGGSIESHSKGLRGQVEPGPIEHPSTRGQLHSYGRNPSSSSGIFEPLFCRHDYLDPGTHWGIFCVSSFKFSVGRIWLDQPGLSLVLLGSGSSLVGSGTRPVPRGCEQRPKDHMPTQDAFLVFAIVFCWQFYQLLVIWFLKGTTSPWNRRFTFSKTFIFIDIGSCHGVSQLLTDWPWEDNVVDFLSTTPSYASWNELCPWSSQPQLGTDFNLPRPSLMDATGLQGQRSRVWVAHPSLLPL